ncbi:MAG: LysR family transcriptional regulator [Bdellovibrionota bacterium]
MKIDDLNGWIAFAGVAKHGNFAKASRALSVPVSILSKRVAKLESQLGVRLFQRSTRVVTMTSEGQALLPKITVILEDLIEAEQTFSASKELSGVVKITAVPFVAHALLIPGIGEFQKKYPRVKIDLHLSEKVENIIERGFDLAIRIQTPEDTDLIYRKLVPNDLVFCASPKYLKKNSEPIRRPDDLIKHKLLFLKIHDRCRFVGSDLQLKKFSSAKEIESDSGAFLTDLALNDFGILVRSIWDVKQHLKAGRLVRLLEKYPLETFGHIHAVIPSGKFLAPRARVFYEFVLEKSKSWRA